MFDLLEGWLRHKSDMVNYEAARAICQMRGVTAPQLTRSIAQLQLFLSSPKPTLKFAAIRTLSALAVSHPSSVAACNVDMENLISDQNRSIATYAITTLLKVRPPPNYVSFPPPLGPPLALVDHSHRRGTKPLWTD